MVDEAVLGIEAREEVGDPCVGGLGDDDLQCRVPVEDTSADHELERPGSPKYRLRPHQTLCTGVPLPHPEILRISGSAMEMDREGQLLARRPQRLPILVPVE